MKKLIYITLLLSVVFSSCSKTDISFTEIDKDFGNLKSILNKNLIKSDFENLNWNKIKKSDKKDKAIVYSLNFKNDINKRVTGIKIGNQLLVQLEIFTIKNGILKIIQEDLITREKRILTKELIGSKGQPSFLSNSVNGDPPGEELPTVVVYSYINNDINNYFFFSQFFSSNLPNLYYYNDYIIPGDYYDVGGSSGTPAYNEPPIDVIVFESDQDAIDFFNWVEDGNPLEKALAALYPVQAYSVYKNSKIAIEKAQEWAINHPGQQNSLSDGKADALRHSYWNALNESSIGTNYAKLFADAHEFGSTRPSSIPIALWNVQREMDLHNNNIGRGISNNEGWSFFTTSSTIWDYFNYGNGNGNIVGLKYICLENDNYTLLFIYENCP